MVTEKAVELVSGGMGKTGKKEQKTCSTRILNTITPYPPGTINVNGYT